jgi:hypothetical protein
MKQALAKQETNTISTVVRPELNLEKWFAIWTPTKSKSKPKLKVLEKKVTLEDGSFTVNQVIINPSLQYGNLTTEDQKVWYGLLLLWEQAGKPQVLVFSLRELARVLGKSWSVKTYESLKKSLMRLRISTFSWINSYYDSTTNQTLKLLEMFNIIMKLNLAEIIDGHTVNSEKCTCEFDTTLYQNLLKNYTKPIYFNEILKLKSGVAQLIYKYLELVMHDKTYYERNSENLFDDIGLDDDEYKFVSARKRILLAAIEELKEIPFPGGILHVSIEQTVDKSDWKLVVKKIPIEVGKPKKLSKPKEPKQEPVKNTLSLQEEILSYFIERFGLRREPSKAEIETAKELIKSYQLNFEMAKQIVDYSKSAAAETNYKPQNFSGIIQYVGIALEQYKTKQNKARIKEDIKKCNFCNKEGLLGAIEPSGRRVTLYCPHDAEALKLKAAKWNFKLEFWSENSPEFQY